VGGILASTTGDRNSSSCATVVFGNESDRFDASVGTLRNGHYEVAVELMSKIDTLRAMVVE